MTPGSEITSVISFLTWRFRVLEILLDRNQNSSWYWLTRLEFGPWSGVSILHVKTKRNKGLKTASTLQSVLPREGHVRFATLILPSSFCQSCDAYQTNGNQIYYYALADDFFDLYFFQYTKEIVRICKAENMKILQGKHQEDKQREI